MPLPGLERDHPQLQRRAEHERRAEARVPGERELVLRREDPNPHRPALPRRQHEDGLGEAELERQRLHRQLVEVARVGEDGELVAGERRVGEDVGDDVAERAHRPESILQARAPDPRPPRPLGSRRPGRAAPAQRRAAATRRARSASGSRSSGRTLVVSSPLLRARETAAAIAKAAGAELRVDERLAPGARGGRRLAAVGGRGRDRRHGRPPAGLLGDRARPDRHRSGLPAGRLLRAGRQLSPRSSRCHQSASHSISSIP